MGFAEPLQAVGCLIGIAELPIQNEGAVVQVKRLCVLASAVGHVTQTVEGVGLARGVPLVASQREGGLAMFTGLLVVAQAGVQPAHSVEHRRLPCRLLQEPEQTKRDGGVLECAPDVALLVPCSGQGIVHVGLRGEIIGLLCQVKALVQVLESFGVPPHARTRLTQVAVCLGENARVVLMGGGRERGSPDRDVVVQVSSTPLEGVEHPSHLPCRAVPPALDGKILGGQKARVLEFEPGQTLAAGLARVESKLANVGLGDISVVPKLSLSFAIEVCPRAIGLPGVRMPSEVFVSTWDGVLPVLVRQAMGVLPAEVGETDRDRDPRKRAVLEVLVDGE